MVSGLSFRNSAHLFLSNIAARFGIDGRVPVSLDQTEDMTFATVDARKVAIPAAPRWSNYKRGWKYRTDRLMYHFGLGDVVSISPGDTVIDIGANIGEFSLAAAAAGAKVHAIEGDPTVFRCLQFNIAGQPNIHAHQNVIWKEDTHLTFYSEPARADSSVFQPPSASDARAIEVDAVSLDSLATRTGLGGVAFLKCDAEGAEPEVIEGGRALLSRTRAVAFDTGPERMGQETSEACETLLRDLGFDVQHQRRRGRKITFGLRRGAPR